MNHSRWLLIQVGGFQHTSRVRWVISPTPNESHADQEHVCRWDTSLHLKPSTILWSMGDIQIIRAISWLLSKSKMVRVHLWLILPSITLSEREYVGGKYRAEITGSYHRYPRLRSNRLRSEIEMNRNDSLGRCFYLKRGIQINRRSELLTFKRRGHQLVVWMQT